VPAPPIGIDALRTHVGLGGRLARNGPATRPASLDTPAEHRDRETGLDTPAARGDPPARRGPMDAITLLKNDHDKMKRLLNDLEATTERGIKTRTELFATIKGELTLHEIIEEEIFYPELKAHPRAKDIVLEGYEEHHVVDLLMGELEQLDVDDESWGAKATVMKENVEHHMEEEEGEMFKKARQVFDAAELDDLGARMEARKATAGREMNIPIPAR
jgi:hypothetical protein